MKKLLIAFSLVAGSMFAGQEIVFTAEVAPFGEITKKVTLLGHMINNPIVPTLLIGAGQQQITGYYGPFRSDSPAYSSFYADIDGLKEALKNDEDEPGANNLVANVVIYPTTEGIATMALNHPGSTKDDDGVLHLLAGGANPHDRWVKYTQDGKYCSIAPSAELAKRAIEDFEKSASARAVRANTERAILRIDFNERALALAKLLNESTTKKQCKDAQMVTSEFVRKIVELKVKRSGAGKNMWDNFAGGVFVFDLDSNGFVFDIKLDAKKGINVPTVAGKSVPAGSFDKMPAEPSIFFAGLSNYHSAYEYPDDESYKNVIKDVVNLLRNELVKDVKGNEKCKKFETVIEDAVKTTADFLEKTERPDDGDWCSIVVSVDEDKNPYMQTYGRERNAEKNLSLCKGYVDQIAAALEKQWPGKNMLVKNENGHLIDWSAVIDVLMIESCGTNDAAVVKAANNAKKTIADVLGSTKSEIHASIKGDEHEGYIAKPGFKAPANPLTGEKRVASVLPETKEVRPGALFFFSPYGLVRNAVLPIMAKVSKEKDAKQYQAMITGMPEPEADSAIAAATWINKDGSVRGIVRITAHEVKNYGAAFNALTAASMATSISDSSDEEDSDEE